MYQWRTIYLLRRIVWCMWSHAKLYIEERLSPTQSSMQGCSEVWSAVYAQRKSNSASLVPSLLVHTTEEWQQHISLSQWWQKTIWCWMERSGGSVHMSLEGNKTPWQANKFICYAKSHRVFKWVELTWNLGVKEYLLKGGILVRDYKNINISTNERRNQIYCCNRYTVGVWN